MKITGSEIIINMLEKHGIRIITGIPGGSVLPIYHALAGSKIRHILARHEQGAGFIAQGMARSTGKPAVCITTSGPGATNLVTALADAKSDSVPIIAITGQVAQSIIGTDAFQEVNTCAIMSTVVKKAYQIKNIEEIPVIFDEAFYLSTAGRPGPILIDIPKDIQMGEKEISESFTHGFEKPIDPVIDMSDISELAKMINTSKRPVIYAGGGIIISKATELLKALAHRNSIPVTTTLMGLGCFPFDDSLFLGIPGMHGARCTNYLLHRADLLLAFGVRFDDRVTGKVKEFCPDAMVAHIDIDIKELGKIRKPDLSIHGDIRESLNLLLAYIELNERENWTSELANCRSQHDIKVPLDNHFFHPVNFIKSVSSFANEDAIITTDVGQHQMWVAQHYGFNVPRTLLTSGGQGTMGFGLPAAIGAAMANPDRKVIAFCGDGSILMNIQELATLADLKANVHILVMNNGQLGMVRQQQELFYNQNYFASYFETKVDYASVARAFGIHAYDLNLTSRPLEMLERALKEPGPCLINVPIESEHNVYPMVPPGAANLKMIG
jgi:acetolactate synthase I/II/III large subunit